MYMKLFNILKAKTHFLKNQQQMQYNTLLLIKGLKTCMTINNTLPMHYHTKNKIKNHSFSFHVLILHMITT